MGSMGRELLEIAIPTYNGNILDVIENVPTLLHFLEKNVSIPWVVTLAHNGKKGDRFDSLQEFAKNKKGVRITAVPTPGKGSAVLNNLLHSSSSIFAYMDADLATGIEAIPSLIDTIHSGADMVSGSRYHPQSIIQRDPVRFFVSWIYTRIILRFLNARFTDPQCGFKAFKTERIRPFLPLVQDSWFFFETEVEYIAQRKNLVLVEIPVVWKEMSNSSVKLGPKIINFLKNTWRLRFSPMNESSAAWNVKPVVIFDAKPMAAKKLPTMNEKKLGR